jgi:hypothetical protein
VNDGFRVDLDELEAHARAVQALAERVRRVVAVGRPLDTAAYGVVGQVFAVAGAGACRSGAAGVARVAERAAGHADGVRAAARAYRASEQRTAAGFGGPR